MAGPPPPRRSRSPSRQQAVAARPRTIELSSPIARCGSACAQPNRRSLERNEAHASHIRELRGHPAHQRRTPHTHVGANIATSGRRTLARDEVQQCRTAARYRRPRCRNEAKERRRRTAALRVLPGISGQPGQYAAGQAQLAQGEMAAAPRGASGRKSGWRWDDRPRSGPRCGALTVRRQPTRAPHTPHRHDPQRRHALRQVPRDCRRRTPARVHRTSRHADETSSNDRGHTRHVTRAYPGATRARVAQAWTRLL
jgi:hypothetical protein